MICIILSSDVYDEILHRCDGTFRYNVGMLMMAARFVDAFSDVTMGQIVDRSANLQRMENSVHGSSAYVRSGSNYKFSGSSGRICRYVLWI